MKKIGKPETKFQKWFYRNLMKRKWTCKDVAKELHITEETVINHYNNEASMKYIYFMGYCVLFVYNPKIAYRNLFKKEGK